VKFSELDSVASPDIALIRTTLAKSSVEYTPADDLVRTAQTARQMPYKFFRRLTKGKKGAPIPMRPDEPSQPIDLETGMKHKLFMAAFVIILAAAMLGWLYVLTWGISKLIGFF
jgi:hypothetical protein